jgi:hypothetical protein
MSSRILGLLAPLAGGAATAAATAAPGFFPSTDGPEKDEFIQGNNGGNAMRRLASPRRRLALASLVALAFGSALTAIAPGSVRQNYVSARYHYSLPVPAGLKLAPAKADQIYGLFPSAPSPEVDFFGTGPANDARGIAIASVQLPAGTTLESWAQTNIQAIAHHFSCHAPKQKAIRLDGTPAIELVYAPSCYGNFDTIEVVHGGRGYDVYWLGPAATRSQDQARFHLDIKAFRFTP